MANKNHLDLLTRVGSKKLPSIKNERCRWLASTSLEIIITPATTSTKIAMVTNLTADRSRPLVSRFRIRYETQWLNKRLTRLSESLQVYVKRAASLVFILCFLQWRIIEGSMNLMQILSSTSLREFLYQELTHTWTPLVHLCVRHQPCPLIEIMTMFIIGQIHSIGNVDTKRRVEG